MAMTVKEVKEWLETFEEHDFIAIDDDGLALVGLAPDGTETQTYLEVGGVPLSEEDSHDDDDCNRPEFAN